MACISKSSDHIIQHCTTLYRPHYTYIQHCTTISHNKPQCATIHHNVIPQCFTMCFNKVHVSEHQHILNIAATARAIYWMHCGVFVFAFVFVFVSEHQHVLNIAVTTRTIYWVHCGVLGLLAGSALALTEEQ